MKSNGAVGSLVLGVSLILAAAIYGAQERPQPIQQQPGDPSGPGYLTHISTDKPIYRTGEKVYVRGVVLKAEGHTPGATGAAYFEVKGPKGETVTSGSSRILDSIIGFSWDIPAAQAGGEYTIRIFHPVTGDAPAERKFDIRAYRAPRLKSQIVFARDGYGPGDTVTATVHVDRAEGGFPAGARVSVSALVDSVAVTNAQTVIDAAGNASTSFKLPATIERGDGTLGLTIQDGGIVETASKTIPILLQTIDLAMYPEGGDLVAGLTNRVYIEGRTPAKKPADMSGVIVDRAGREVAQFRTEHDGRGRFSFVPARGEVYSLRVIEPAGIRKTFPLPAVKDSGVVLTATSDVTAKQKDIAVRVAATRDGNYGVALTQHGKEIGFKSVDLRANRSSDVTFTLPRTVDGVVVATVYAEDKTPLAERLLFRQPEHRLEVRVTPDRLDYVPGDKVTLKVTTMDDGDKPVSAFVGLTVSDSSVIEMIDKREQTGRLPVMVFLESEVKDLSDAHVYLDAANPKAPLATDLLLGTQGWRRFAAVDSARFFAANGDAARRVLGTRMLTDAERALARPIVLQAAARGPGGGGARGGGAGAAAGLGVGVGQGVVGGIAGGVLFERLAAAAPAPPPPASPPPAAAPELAQRKEIAADAIAVGRGAAAAGGAAGAGGGRGVAGAQLAALQREVFVREYAHPLRPGWTEGSRSDFAETVYWNAGVKTDPATGTASVSFNLSDSVTAFRVSADGFDQNGTLGSYTNEIESVRPFYIEPKMPLQVTSGDVIQLPIGVVNGMNRELRGTQIAAKTVEGVSFRMVGDSSDTLRGKERGRRILELSIGREFSGNADLTLDASAGSYRDTVTRKFNIQPLGFPFERGAGGMLEPNSTKSFEFTLPGQIVKGSLSSTIMVYPTPLASMTEALQALLREPYGCFEQTSSTSYPMVMAQRYFTTHTGVDPALVEKTKGLLESSYKRLTGFESKTKGYEWFGADPGHEALTAYGLLQFTDMAQVRSVDKDMLDRTRNWLLARRDGNGGFSLNPKALDSFGRAPADTTAAYITWALVESGQKGLEKEIAAVKASANATQDSYIVALAANILHASGDLAGARSLMEKLTKSQELLGNVKGATTSITRSGGDALLIETTALSVLAWMREPAYAANVEKGLRWIIESNKNGRFGSTQSTVLALRSIIAYDAVHARPKAAGKIVLLVDGEPIGKPVAFSTDTQGALVLPEFANQLAPGKHTVTLKMEEGSNMPYSIAVKYYSVLPDSAEQTQIGIQVSLKDKQIREGGITEAVVAVTNKSSEAIPTPVAIVGIPGGLEVRHDQLKELVKAGRIDAYEVIGREVVLYWRVLKGKDKFDLPVSLIAAVPGTYTGPASRAYLYYTDEYKNWAPGLQVSISPR